MGVLTWKDKANGIWQDFCREFGFTRLSTSHAAPNEVRARYADWIITLEGVSRERGFFGLSSSLARCPFIMLEDFRFLIVRASKYPGLGSPDGLKVMHTGDKDFDSEFIVWANQLERAKQLFGNERLRELLAQMPHLWLSVRPEEWLDYPRYPKGVFDLVFRADVPLADPMMQQNVVRIFAAVLDQLCDMGVASDKKPMPEEAAMASVGRIGT